MEHHIKAVWSDTEVAGEKGAVIRALGSINAQLMEQAERQHISPAFVLTELGRAVGNAYCRKDTEVKKSVTVDLSDWTTDMGGKNE